MCGWVYEVGFGANMEMLGGGEGESTTAFERDLDGGGGRSSIGDGGVTMCRGRGLAEAGERAGARGGRDGNMWGEEHRLKRNPRMGC